MDLKDIPKQLPFLVILIGFWVAPGLWFIAIHYPDFFAAADAWKLALCAVAIPAIPIALLLHTILRFANNDDMDNHMQNAIFWGGALFIVLDIIAFRHPDFSVSASFTVICVVAVVNTSPPNNQKQEAKK